MRHLDIRILAVASLLSLALAAGSAMARQHADKPDQKDAAGQHQHDPQQGPGPVVIPMGGGAAMAIKMGPGGAMFGMDQLAPVIAILGDLNLAPDFTLSAEQEQKIQSIRDDFKQSMEAWRKDHEEELKQLDEQQQAIFENMQNGGGPPDPGQMMELAEARQQLMQTAPSGEDHAQQVKATLTPEQLKRFEEKQAAQEQERQAMMSKFPGFRIGPGRFTPAGGQNPPGDGDKDRKGK